MDAILITPDATAQRLTLPDTGDAQREALAVRIGDSIDRGYYHHQAVMHLHGAGNTTGVEMPPNFAAWALACAWRGLTLPYYLCGLVVITGPDKGGSYTSLTEDLMGHAEHAAACARTLTGRPVSELLGSVAEFTKS